MRNRLLVYEDFPIKNKNILTNEAMATLDQMGSRYQSSRAMRRKQIAAAALRDAAQDASLYAKVYDAGFSKLVGDMAEGIEGKEEDE